MLYQRNGALNDRDGINPFTPYAVSTCRVSSKGSGELLRASASRCANCSAASGFASSTGNTFTSSYPGRSGRFVDIAFVNSGKVKHFSVQNERWRWHHGRLVGPRHIRGAVMKAVELALRVYVFKSPPYIAQSCRRQSAAAPANKKVRSSLASAHA